MLQLALKGSTLNTQGQSNIYARVFRHSRSPVGRIDMSLEGIVYYQPLGKWQQSHRVHMSCKFSPAPRGACARKVRLEKARHASISEKTPHQPATYPTERHASRCSRRGWLVRGAGHLCTLPGCASMQMHPCRESDKRQ